VTSTDSTSQFLLLARKTPSDQQTLHFSVVIKITTTISFLRGLRFNDRQLTDETAENVLCQKRKGAVKMAGIFYLANNSAH